MDIAFYDVRQCFDALWTEKVIVDLYKNGVKDNHLNLIHNASANVNIAVKTPVGITTRRNIKNIIIQGETYSSIICTSTMDNKCLKRKKGQNI